MKISLLVPTCDRTEDLKVLFNSLETQKLKPYEVIVVDQSEEMSTKILCELFASRLPLRYFYYPKKSSTHSRNFGISKTEGDIIAFLDDDTELLSDYVWHIKNFYKKYPGAIGGMGRIVNFSEFEKRVLGKGFLNFAYKITASFFGTDSFRRGFRVLPSGRNTSDYNSDRPAPAEWLSGSSSWYRKEIFNEFTFEEKFERWAFGEDCMLSYRIQKKYKNSLYYYPAAKLRHFESPRGRMDMEHTIRVKTIYRFWFFDKCVHRSRFFYWRANAGEVILHFINALIGREPFKNSVSFFKANLLLLINRKSIENGNLTTVLKKNFKK